MAAPRIFSLLAIPSLAAPFCVAFAWELGDETSTVTMYATKQGDWFDGVFHEFTAAIEFDPANPSAGSIVGVVQTESIDTGDDQNDNYIFGYLEVEQFPEARFQSQSITPTNDGFQATGELTLKGITKPAVINFTFTVAEDDSPSARFWGAMTIDRFAHDIAADIDTGWAGKDVEVRIDLALKR